MRRRWFRSIRARLTFWYAGVLAAILLLYGAGVYVFVRQSLYQELDRRLRDDFEAAEEGLERREDGEVGRRAGTAIGHHQEDEVAQRWLDVWGLDGSLLYREGPAEPVLPLPDSTDRGARGATVSTVALGAGPALRVRSGTYSIGGSPVLIRVARSEDGVRHELAELLAGMGLGLPAAVLLAGFGGFFLAGRALKPVGQMAARAETITAERLGERLPVENPDDELGRLGTVFNETLARLERSFETLRRFTADAAHELRTPLTALRSVGEVSLREGQANEGSREVLGSMLEEVDRLTRLVDTLLTLSRSDRGQVEIRRERLDLKGFARETAEYLEVLAEEKGQRIVLEGDSEVYAHADPRLLRQAVLNILDNAIRYSPERVPIRVAARRQAGAATLEVTDQGPGIAPEHQERIFERFYRVDTARSRETGGAGLGLSIAQWAVRANGGTIEVESQVGAGSCFRICLPLADAPAGGE
jgi:heavy metal sensor kinase